ncbi:apoptosis inhibitor 5-like isoform X2 [Antedon mediterranea]|uniref:apoptosis inhibitor 5-like isoform X2 n=1 Tax=Antedon mediterranea TaxID=105859 RepID=UPI003AF67907
MVDVEQLYKDYGVLADAKENASEHKEAYANILSASQGGQKEKRLAAQFIPKFFKYFLSEAEQVIDAQLDLCEDDDGLLRRQAIKELPNLCKDAPDHLPRIADVLTQLLQSEDQAEFNCVQNAFIAVFKLDAKGALGGLFAQIQSGEDLVRDRAIKFLSTKVKSLGPDIITKDVEEQIIEKSKEILHDVTGDEFVAFMKLLSSLSTMQTLLGRQQLVNIAIEQADLKADFVPSDPDCVDKLTQCIKQALPFFSKNVHSTKFIEHISNHVVPFLSELAGPEGTNVKLEVLKLLAEMSTHCGDYEDRGCLEKVHNALLEYMPLPPAEVEEGENGKDSDEPKLQFSIVECLMYTLHQMGKKCPDFFTAEENLDRLKDFRLRLQYFARGNQVYMKQLRADLRDKTGDVLKSDENKIKVVALKITTNINALIKDLFRNPPGYGCIITLSWKPIQKATTEQTQQQQSVKRGNITPITFSESGPAKKATVGGGNKQRGARGVYHPPGGRYSAKAGNAPSGGDANYGNNFTGGQQRRGGFRGRGWSKGRGRGNRF